MVALAAWTPVAASTARSESDAVDRTYQVSIYNPLTGSKSISDILITTVTLSLVKPGGNGREAPRGVAYLTFAATSSVNPRIANNPSQPPEFGGMTPLPSSALKLVLGKRRVYSATRFDATTPMMEFYSSDDGLIDATYYFTVPISTRRGSIVIEPSRTIGYEITDLNNQGPYELRTSGPTMIPFQFTGQLVDPAGTRSGSSVASAIRDVVEWLAILSCAVAAVVVTRRRRAPSTKEASPVPVPAAPPRPAAPRVDVVAEPIGTSPPRSVSSPERLTVNVLGPLTFDPPLGSAKEAVRAIVTFLALHDDRPISRGELMTALYPTTSTTKDVTEASFLNRISEVRRAVGVGHLPEAQAGRYRFVNVTTDWHEFRHLARVAQTRSGKERLVTYVEAMSLVRGEAFTAEVGRNFEWVRERHVDAEIVRGVIDVTNRAQREFVMAGDLAGAERVLRRGLRLAPVATQLWEALTDVLLECQDPSVMDLHFHEAEAALGEGGTTLLRARASG